MALQDDLAQFELIDEKSWQKVVDNSRDFYGYGILKYAARWASLMEISMANGNNLKDIAKATSGEANTEGITGFMYGTAISLLSQIWKHGEELQRWHNLTMQIGDEGEKANEIGTTLNPALVKPFKMSDDIQT